MSLVASTKRKAEEPPTEIIDFVPRSLPSPLLFTATGCYTVRRGQPIPLTDRITVVALELLGSGNFSQVYRVCRIAEPARQFALKIASSKIESRDCLDYEKQILQKLNGNDPHNVIPIIRLYGSFKINHDSDSFSSLILELCQQDLRSSGTFKFSLIPAIGEKILRALQFLKENKTIHSDLKPENIFSKPTEPRFVIADFGLAGTLSDIKQRQEVQPIYYRAPEVVLHLERSYPIDMWSFGACALELFLGFPLFDYSSEPLPIANNALKDNLELLFRMFEVLGFPPKELSPILPRLEAAFSTIRHKEPGSDSISSLIKRKFESEKIDEGLECDRMIDFFERILTWDAKKRMTPEEALRHPYITR